ncbi:hypothetical protein SUDANB178_00001 [Streptomyces sp. enrichment culture]
MLEIRDPSPVLGESEEARRGRRLALLQTALLEHAAAHNLRTVMTFHQKVEEAAAFAEKLPETAAELYVNDATDDDLAAADKLPKSSIDAEFYELEAGRHVPPDRVWSAWLCGDHLVSERREVLHQFASERREVLRCTAPASTPPGAGCTAPSSPAFACSGRAWTSPANGESTRSASQTPAARRWRSCRTSAGRSGSTATVPPRWPGSSCRCSWSPARTRRTWSPAPRSAPSWPYFRACARTMNDSSSNWPRGR